MRLLYVVFMVCLSVLSHIFFLSVLALKKRRRYSMFGVRTVLVRYKAASGGSQFALMRCLYQPIVDATPLSALLQSRCMFIHSPRCRMYFEAGCDLVICVVFPPMLNHCQSHFDVFPIVIMPKELRFVGVHGNVVVIAESVYSFVYLFSPSSDRASKKVSSA